LTPPPTGRLLVADDEEMYRNLVVRHLTSRGHSCESTGDGRHAIALASTAQFDVVLADLKMPGADGLTIVREVSRAVPAVPLVLVTGHASLDHAIRAVRYGCTDLLLKPFHLDLLDECVARALTRRRALRDAEDHRRVLEKRLEELTARLVRAEQSVTAPTAPAAADVSAFLALADAADFRGGLDPGHGRRTRALAEIVARRLGLVGDDVHAIAVAALVHDAGMVLLPDAAVAPPAERSPQGQALFQRHVTAGAELLRRAGTMAALAPWIEAHHEHWDGSGFPRGLRGPEIPLGAQVVAVADGADEFLSSAATRGPSELESFLLRGRGARFSPAAADALLSVSWDEIARARSGPLVEPGPRAPAPQPSTPEPAVTRSPSISASTSGVTSPVG
jgi:response regulator RpfG family c-di-GMP phosphodiesterase